MCSGDTGVQWGQRCAVGIEVCSRDAEESWPWDRDMGVRWGHRHNEDTDTMEGHRHATGPCLGTQTIKRGRGHGGNKVMVGIQACLRDMGTHTCNGGPSCAAGTRTCGT